MRRIFHAHSDCLSGGRGCPGGGGGRLLPTSGGCHAAEITDRLAYYADHFWILEEDDGTVVSFVDGMTTDEPTLRDEMYENAALHDKDGTWQMIFGVNTLPAYRCRAAPERCWSG